MKIINYEYYNKSLYYEKLDNGLQIYILPNNTVKDIYVTFTTRYGGCNYKFKVNNKFISVPNGIAHFLEHKLFEQKNGIDPMIYFSKNGAYCNAETDYKYTSYLFACNSAFNKNLEYLLNYVQSPYFTDKNVEKEKGIITEELKMYDDMPSSFMIENLMYNLIKKHPIQHPIGGKVEDIIKITKEDLYNCYNTFYNPSNMFIVITGNVDPSKTIELIKKNQSKKKFKSNTIELETIKESLEVKKKKEVKIYNVTTPMVSYAFKIRIKGYNIDIRKLKYYIYMIFDILFDKCSIFYEKMVNEKLLNNQIKLNTENIEDYFIFILNFKTIKYNKVLKEIDNTLKNINITQEELDRKKKVYISSIYYMFDSIDGINSLISSNLINYNDIYSNIYEIINSMNLEELNHIINNLNVSNNSIYILKNK